VELAANPRLTERVVQDLNRNPRLPYGEGEFDGAALCVSIDYLTQPVAVLRDMGRVLKPGAPLVITFSNRCFPTKAIAIWTELDDAGHVALVAGLLKAAGAWDRITTYDRSPRLGDPLYAVVGRALPARDG
jgi:SAM-dependent methyltransferase